MLPEQRARTSWAIVSRTLTQHEVLAVVVHIAKNQHPDRVGLVHRQAGGLPAGNEYTCLL